MQPVPVSRPRWGVAWFILFWRAPGLDLPGDERAADMHAYWPGQNAPRVETTAYTATLRLLLQWVTDFRLANVEHAGNGDDTCIRWIARRTWRGAPLAMAGVVRARQRGGQMIENGIACSRPPIDALLMAVDRG